MDSLKLRKNTQKLSQKLAVEGMKTHNEEALAFAVALNATEVAIMVGKKEELVELIGDWLGKEVLGMDMTEDNIMKAVSDIKEYMAMASGPVHGEG